MAIKAVPIRSDQPFAHHINAAVPTRKIVKTSHINGLALGVSVVSLPSTQPPSSRATSMKNNTKPMPAKPASASSLTATN